MLMPSKSNLILKLAIKSEDLQQLRNWNSSPTSSQALRYILGNIMSRLNEISQVIKAGSNRQIDTTIVAQARLILPDMANIQLLQNEAKKSLELIQKQETSPHVEIIERMVHAIMQARVSEEQIKIIENISNGSIQIDNRGEIEIGKMQEFLKSSIYSSAGDSEKTMKVLRELLQNACDAAVKQSKNTKETIPSIEIKTWSYKLPGFEDLFMDMMVTDNGVGMDWNILSRKFFVYFASGKEDEAGAGGGFGIAKGLIQLTPKHGWSVESGGIHSNSFERNMYFSDPDKYVPPKPQIKVAKQGTTITLYGLPHASEYSIKDLCQKYSMGQVGIKLNGEPIIPRLDINKLTYLDDNLNGLADAISDDSSKKDIAQHVIEKNKQDINLGQLSWTVDNIKTTARIGVQRNTTGNGRLFVMLNGQYQFDEYLSIEQAGIICSIKTNARPNTEHYPTTPGRDSLRSPYKESIFSVVEKIKGILSDIAKTSLFKDGISIQTFNSGKNPINVQQISQQGEKSRILEELETVMQSPSLIPEDDTKKSTEEEGTTEEEDITEEEGTTKKENIVEKEINKSEVERKINELENTRQISLMQKKMILSVLEDTGQTISHSELLKIIDIVDTPCSIVVQNGFIKEKEIKENPDLISNLMVVWLSTIRRIIQTSSKLYRRENNNPVIPGVIFSKEANAISLPPKEEQKNHILAINPISVAALVEPDRFAKLIQGASYERIPKNTKIQEDVNIQEFEKSHPEESVANRLASFIHHVAIHEITHYKFPDYGYGSETFHRHVTILEHACHFDFAKTKKEVYHCLKGIKADTRKLLKLLSLKTPKIKDPNQSGIPRQKTGLLPKELDYDTKRNIWDDKLYRNKSFQKLEEDFGLQRSNGMTAYRIFNEIDYEIGKKIDALVKQYKESGYESYYKPIERKLDLYENDGWTAKEIHSRYLKREQKRLSATKEINASLNWIKEIMKFGKSI